MAFEYRFNVIRFYSKLNRFVLSPRKKPNHFVLKIRPGGFADYKQLWMEELMKEKFLLQEQLSDEKVRVKNMQMKLAEVESALSDWKQKYSEIQREYRAYVAKVEANGFKYLMINLKKWIKNNYLLLLLVALAVWVIYLLYQLFFLLF